MAKRTIIDAFNVSTKKNHYTVTMERLKNNINGIGRYKSTIIYSDPTGTPHAIIYTFTGHCFGARGEAEYIVERYEKEIEKEC